MQNNKKEIINKNKIETELENITSEIEKINEMMASASDLQEELSLKVVKDNNDRLSQAQLSEIEKELAGYRLHLRTMESRRKKLRDKLNVLRLEEENKQIDSMQSKIKDLRLRRDELRNKLIPAAAKKLQQLNDELENIDDEIEQINKDIHKWREKTQGFATSTPDRK